MSRWFRVAGLTAGLLVGGGLASESWAQEPEPGEVTIAIYRVAPGKHLEFLRWQASQAAVAKEAGATPARWYVHQDGDSWDYVSIDELDRDPQKEAQLEEKIESLAKKKGLPTGFAAGLQFRQFIASHTDTRAAGPLTIEELVKRASAP